MRKIGILTLLFVVIISLPIGAFSPRDSYLDTVASIAWMEGETLNVALGNASSSRTNITISTNTLDAWGRPVFRDTSVSVPGRTIVVESFRPAIPVRGGELIVKVSEGYRSINVRVQSSDIMEPEEYIVQSNSVLKTIVDLAFLQPGARRIRLIVDDFYQTGDGYGRGPIDVTDFEGGLRYVRSTRTVEYVRPYMVLSLNTPQITGLTVLTFALRKTEDGYGWRDEEIPGPSIMVYGRNVRFSSSSPSNESGWHTR